MLHSSYQEISQLHTLARPRAAAPRLDSNALARLTPLLALMPLRMLATRHFPSRAMHARDFARWALERPERIVVAGHSLWFRSFFQCHLPPTSSCIQEAQDRELRCRGLRLL